MSIPVLVVITGPACTGKTSLGRRLSEEIGLPFFYKDGFKEMMYDVVMEQGGLARITPEVTRTLGKISIECLRLVMETMLAQNLSLIVEGNFDRDLFSPCVQQLQQRYAPQILQVQLKCQGKILLERYLRREQEDRHPGHQGVKYLDSLRHAILLAGEQAPLEVEGDLFVVDTTDFGQVNYEPIFTRLRCFLNRM
jgi:cytidylate kinase